jgi:hypothetical protein
MMHFKHPKFPRGLLRHGRHALRTIAFAWQCYALA